MAGLFIGFGYRVCGYMAGLFTGFDWFYVCMIGFYFSSVLVTDF
jgi:hypothetical protein